MRHHFIVAVVIGIAVTSVMANGFVPVPTADLVEHSDLIVVGKVKIRDKLGSIEVSEVLKGPAAKTVVLSTIDLGMYGPVVKDGQEGVFILVSDRVRKGAYRVRHPSCVQTPDAKEHVKGLVALFIDPAPFVNLSKHTEHTDYAHALGSIFAGYRISSEEVPTLGQSMQRFAQAYYEVAPWKDKGIVVFKCQYDSAKKPALTIESARPPGPLADHLRSRLVIASQWDYVKESLPGRFTITLDARWPEKCGNLSAEDAVAYLRARVKAKNAEVVHAAILALAKMRDEKAVGTVLDLLSADDLQTRFHAVRFLGWSRDTDASHPLCKLLETLDRPDDHRLADEISVALKSIADTSSVPALEQATRRGFQRAAEALGAIAREQSFTVLLEVGESDPGMCGIETGLYWMMRRSNKPEEKWMATPTWSPKIGAEQIPRWRKWWNANKNDFKVIRTLEEAFQMEH